MDKYKVDYTHIEKALEKTKLIPYEDAKDRIQKVAFDTVIFRDKPEALWKVVSGDDGKEYLAAMYEHMSEEPLEKSSWSVEVDRLKKTATIFYKETPITNVNVEKIHDTEDFKARLPNLIASDKSLVNKMLSEVDSDYKQQILSKHPELL